MTTGGRRSEVGPSTSAVKTLADTADRSLQAVGETGLSVLLPTASERSKELAKDLRSRAERRADVPLRVSFVRDDDPAVVPPLALLVGAGGRGGGAVALKLYLSLVWLASAPPFSTDQVSARVWAELLDLPDPAGRGKKRVTAALTKLEQLRLIRVKRSRGEPSAIRLLHESGNGQPYPQIPSTAYERPADVRERQRYIRINTRLWTEGHLQSMSAQALALLLVVLEEQYGKHHDPVWWSEERFQTRFNLHRNTKSKGGKELVQRRLAVIQRKSVSPRESEFGRHKTRNTYRPIGAALPSDWRDPAPETGGDLFARLSQGVSTFPDEIKKAVSAGSSSRT